MGSITMSDALVTLGASTFFICVGLFFISLIMLIVSSYQKDAKQQAKTKSIALKMLFVGVLGGAIGFGVCAANFTLNLH